MTLNIEKQRHIVILVLSILGISSLFVFPVDGNSSGEVVEQTRYSWPMKIYNGLSSSFQEFRSSHFHGGFDLRTFQKTGYPVVTVADGYVYRIRVVKRGSGNGLYIKHKDGNVSIYYHLNRFEHRIEALLKKEQRRQGKKYIGNYYPNTRIHYKRGQVIAYSGETGSGFPHLHFEVRDADNVAINPFPLVRFPAAAKDKRLPVMQGILLRNREDTTINGEVGEMFTGFRRKARGHYVLKRPFIATGPFDLILKAHDRSDVNRRIAPYSISATLDGRQFYQLAFDRFEWGENNQLGFVYDMERSTSSSMYFNLFFQTGFSLETHKMPFAELFNGLDDGKHRITVTMRDHFDNVSTGDIDFCKTPSPVLSISDLHYSEKGESHLAFNIEKLVAPPEGTITVQVLDRHMKKISSGTLNYNRIDKVKPIRLTNISPDAAYIDFIFHVFSTPYIKKRFLVDTGHLGGISDIPVVYFINRDDIFVTVTDSSLSPRNLHLKVIQGTQSQDVQPVCSKDTFFYRFKPMNRHNRMLLHFTLEKNGEPVLQVEKKLTVIHLENGTPQDFTYHEFSASFGVRAVYEPKLLMVEETGYPSSYPVLSRQIRVSPYHFPFLDTVHYKFKKKVDRPEQVGIFRYQPGSKKWSYRTSPYDAKTRTYSLRLRSSGTFALMRDIFPPKIWWVRPNTRYKKNLGMLLVKIADKGKGVNDGTLKIWLNGVLISKNYACEYDPDRRWVKITGSCLRALKIGGNVLKVFVKDYAGNPGTRSFTFTLR